MNQQKLIRLCVLIVVLSGLYFLLVGREQSVSKKSAADILGGVSGASIARLRIEQGAQVVELALKDGQWGIPARGDYPADSNKVRSLLLKLFDVSEAEPMPSSADAMDKLGLSDEAIKRGQSRITFADAAGKDLGGVRLGVERKGKGEGLAAVNRSGQYIRQVNGQDVFLLPLPITVSSSLSYWFEPTVLSVLQSNVVSITQSSLANNTETPVFELKRDKPEDTKLTLVGEIPAEKKIQDSVLNEVSSGLENLRLDDVYRANAEEVKDLVFDSRSVFHANNALVYEVQTAQKGDKTYAKLSVTFDAEMAKAKQDAAAAAASPTPTPTEAATPIEEGAPIPTPTPVKPTVAVADQKEADKLNARLNPWIFELPGYQAKKLRHKRDELFESSKSVTPADAPATAPGTKP